MTQDTDSERSASGACPWVSRLSDHIDGRLDPGTDAQLRTHIAACEECESTIAELRRVVAMARTVGPIEPPASAWPRIASRIRSGAPMRPAWLRMSMPQAIAAGLTLAFGSGALAWMLATGQTEQRLPGPEEPTVAALEANLASYDAALAEIEEAIRIQPDDAYLRRHLEATIEARADLVETAARLNLAQ